MGGTLALAIGSTLMSVISAVKPDGEAKVLSTTVTIPSMMSSLRLSFPHPRLLPSLMILPFLDRARQYLGLLHWG